MKRKALPPGTLLAAYLKHDGRCSLCGNPVDPANATVDHVIAVANGGTNDPDNLQLAHRSCNARKSLHAEMPPIIPPAPGTIAELREARGWSRDELAKRAGVTRMAVWNWENDQRMPRADQLRAIARALGVSMDEIVLPRTEPTDA